MFAIVLAALDRSGSVLPILCAMAVHELAHIVMMLACGGQVRRLTLRFADLQIAASGLSYLALGHIHQASGLLTAGSTAYAWPGCAMGRGFDELGQKGAYLGRITDAGVQLDFLPLPGRKYEILRVDAGDDALAAVKAALPERTQDDIYRVILTGEAAPVDLPALQAALAPRFYAVAVRDETRPRKDLWQDAADDTLRGLFLQALKAQYDAAPDDAARRIIALAARLGTAAMDGREMDA